MSKQVYFSIFVLAIVLVSTLFIRIFQFSNAVNKQAVKNKSALSYSDRIDCGLKYLHPHPLIYIPTREGLTSRFRQLEIMHSNALSSNRTLTLIDNHSVHYKDLGPINLCKIFTLPHTIYCSPTSLDRVIRSSRCSPPPVPEWKKHLDQRWLFKPSNFGLTSEQLRPLDRAANFSFEHSECVLSFGFYFNLTTTNHSLPIKFTKHFSSLFETAKKNLFASKDEKGGGGEGGEVENELVAVHWRRG
jgi:hypothetical protein